MKQVMISQPMGGKTLEQVISARQQAANCVKDKDAKFLDALYPEDNNRIGSYFADAAKHKDLAYLGLSLLDMANCDTVVFAKGWENARGCQIEHEVAEKYGLEIIEEKD